MAGLIYFWAQCKNKFVGPVYCQVSTNSSARVQGGNEYRENLKHNRPFRPTSERWGPRATALDCVGLVPALKI
jgi:hypothetical protein